jgi:hypothetical protein
MSTNRIDVTAVRSSTYRRPGITLHRARDLQAEDSACHEGIPVTSIARTLLDLAEVVPHRRLDRAVEEAERRGLFNLPDVDRLVARNFRRRGATLLRAVLGEYREPAPTRSELERRFLDLCRDAALPPPAVNAFVTGLEVDFVWHDCRLVVELDGHEFHRTRAAFERDRVRDAALQLAGCRVVRLTHRRLTEEPAEVAGTIRSLLGI